MIETTTDAVRHIEVAAPALPAEFDPHVRDSATELDAAIGSDDSVGSRVMTHGGHLLGGLLHERISAGIVPRFAWPQSLYIPVAADPAQYWITPCPADQRYALDWTNRPANLASKAQGSMFAFGQNHDHRALRLVRSRRRRAAQSEGIAVRGQHAADRLMFGREPLVADARPAGGRTYPAQDEPGIGAVGADSRRLGPRLVAFGGGVRPRAELGLGSAVQPYQRSFSGAQLATPLLVQRGRTYLLGVVARVSIWSTLTGSSGEPLPDIRDGQFKVWGTLACAVPQIEVLEQTVYIP